MELSDAPQGGPDTAVRVDRRGSLLLATLDQPAAGNTLNAALIGGLHAALDRLEVDQGLRVLAIRGRDGVFCDGMDFAEATTTQVVDMAALRDRIRPFWQLLARFGAVPKTVVAVVDGRVNAGGVGLAAACDIVVATPRSGFLLSELMFGLVPATIAPFLIRRIGWQAAWRMTLTAQRIDAGEARAIGLVDDVAGDPDDALRRLMIRLDRMPAAGVAAGKAYFQSLVPLDAEAERRALDAICARIADPEVMAGIRRFIEGEGVPWRRS